MSQTICFKQNSPMENLKNLLTTSMGNVTLISEGLVLKAHKLVLIACSLFFESLFIMDPYIHFVTFADIKYTALKAIVEFMYHGEVNVAQDQLSDFMNAAEILKVKGLVEEITTADPSGLSGRPSLYSNMESLRQSGSSTDNCNSLLPTLMPSNALVTNTQPKSPSDIKPELIELEPPMLPAVGHSHSTNESP